MERIERVQVTWDRRIIREFGMVRLCFFYTSRSKILLLIIIVYSVGIES